MAMKTLRQKTHSFFQTLSRHKLLFTAVAALLILVISIPLAVILSLEGGGHQMSSIIVPLYSYPAPGAWDPLYKAIKESPNLRFIVVVNPHNGPGGSPLPDANYTREIPLLNSYSNVQTLGYVATGYATKDVEAIKNDIRTYSDWSTNIGVQNLRVEGIFFDETPAVFDDASANLLHEIQSEARRAHGFGSQCLLINNPGIIPDARLLHGPNMTVVFEGTYATYQQHSISSKLTKLRQDPERGASEAPIFRNELACIMHSVPVGVADSETAMQRVVRELQRLAGTIYVTDLHEDYYAGFGSGWMRFVDVAT